MADFFAIVIVGVILVAAVVAVPVIAVIAWVRSLQVGTLAHRIARLEAEVARLAQAARSATPRQSPELGTSPEPGTFPEMGVLSEQSAPVAVTIVPEAASEPVAAPASLAAGEVPPLVAESPFTQPPPLRGAPPPAFQPPSQPVAQPYPSQPAAHSSQPRPAALRPPISRPVAGSPIDLEMLIGRQALGWLAVVVLLFATGFFLKYAYENQWVGPLGRVSLGIFGGSALVLAGWRYHRRGWRLFSQMLTSGGVVVLYLSTYSAFGFYQLIPQQAAGVFLALLAAQCALLAVRYDSPAIGLMAVIGGLLTPLLMASERDQYVSLFVYLGVVTAGSLALVAARSWPAIGTVCLLGTQFVFWLWEAANYHPEKRWWAIGFQTVLFLLHAAQSYVAATSRRRGPTWEDVVRVSLNAGAAFLAVRWLLDDEYSLWHGAVAMLFAAFHAVFAHAVYSRPGAARRTVLVAIGISSGFIALALPLQASTSWAALGWAAQASVLWWLGIRVDQRPLRGFAAILAVMAGGRIATFDIPSLAMLRADGQPLLPFLNLDAAPVMATIACLLAGLLVAHKRVTRVMEPERTVAGIGFVLCLLAIWMAVSFDLYGWFRPGMVVASVSATDLPLEPGHWQRLAGMTISSWWTVYASLLLAIGFSVRVGLIRWTALAIFAATIAKVFLYDMADLDQIYRIVAFFVLAVFLGIAAWAYQRIGLKQSNVSPEGSPWP